MRFLGEELLTDFVAFFQSDIFEQLEHLYLPLFTRWTDWFINSILKTSMYSNFRLLCIISSLLLCILSASRLPILVSTACYTNLYVPFSRLNAEILAPLEQEIRGLQQFRQPTSVIFMVDFINTEIFSTRRSWRKLDQRVQCVWM